MHEKHPLCVSVFVGMHQYNFNSGRQKRKKKNNSKYLVSDGISSSIFRLWHRHTGRLEKVRVIFFYYSFIF